MFAASNTSQVYSHVSDLFKHSQKKRFVNAFSGGFVLEQYIVAAQSGAEILSIDPSIFSTVLAHAFMGKDSGIRIIPEIEYLFPKNDFTPLDVATQVLIMSDLGMVLSKADSVAYYSNLLSEYEANKQGYWDKARKKIENLTAILAKGRFNFLHGEIGDYMERLTSDDFLYYDNSQSSDYVLSAKQIEPYFDGFASSYTKPSQELILSRVEAATWQGAGIVLRYAISQNQNIESKLPEGFERIHQTRVNYDKSHALFTNIEADRKVHNLINIAEREVNYDLISDEDEITIKSRIRVVKVGNDVLNHYRLLWIKKARMLSYGFSYLIFIDDKLIGGLQMKTGMQYAIPKTFILSDPVCPFSRYRRLSKLIVAFACTQQFLDKTSEDFMWRHDGVLTKVFSNNNNSMKYRGLMDKTEVTDNDTNSFKFGIMYENKRLFKTYKQALDWWLKGHSKDLNK